MLRFTTFRHRTMFYWSRKNLFKNGVHLDLTKERFTLYQKARDLVKSKKFVNYLYVDVKCQLKIKFKNSQPSCFSCISELLDLTDQECNHGVLGYGAEGTNLYKIL